MRRPTAVLCLLVVMLTACGGEQEDVALVELTASPYDDAATETTPTPTPTPSPTPEASPEPSPSPTPRAATDTDRGLFTRSYRPAGSSDLESAAADLDGDGEKELVFAYVVADQQRSKVDVAWWDGFQYSVGASDLGGPASRVDRLRISDVNADGLIEIVTFQSTSDRASLSIWQIPPERRELVPLVARGGCDDGSHTYGAVGARFTDRDGDGSEEIEATCNEAPLPVSAWRTDRYRWQDGAYRHEPPPAPPSPSPSPSPLPTEDEDGDDD